MPLLEEISAQIQRRFSLQSRQDLAKGAKRGEKTEFAASYFAFLRVAVKKYF
jgi:hypothetical protein